MQKALFLSSPPMTLLQGWPVCSFWGKSVPGCPGPLTWWNVLHCVVTSCDCVTHGHTGMVQNNTDLLSQSSDRGPKLVSRGSNQGVGRTAFLPEALEKICSCHFQLLEAPTMFLSCSPPVLPQLQSHGGPLPAWSRPLFGLWPSSSFEDPVDHPENHGQLLSQDPELHHTAKSFF